MEHHQFSFSKGKLYCYIILFFIYSQRTPEEHGDVGHLYK